MLNSLPKDILSTNNLNPLDSYFRAFLRTNDNSSNPPKILVFTIQPELFETEFKSRSPIDRMMLRTYLEKMVEIYGNFKVLAIDYDLSPNNLTSAQDTPLEQAEQEAQKEIEGYLVKLVNDSKKKIVLINHLPVSSDKLRNRKTQWMQSSELAKERNRILFGYSELFHYHIFGTVVKYPFCVDSFPVVVSDAMNHHIPNRPRLTCKEVLAPTFGHREKLKRINFLKAMNFVKVCRLSDLRGFKDCQRYYPKWNDAEVIFIGGDYGKDDTYLTPLGALPGVTIQAHTYFSLFEPLEPHDLLAFMLDVIIGFFGGLVFHWIWQEFHRNRLCESKKFG